MGPVSYYESGRLIGELSIRIETGRDDGTAGKQLDEGELF